MFFAPRYFAGQFFAPRYFPGEVAAPVFVGGNDRIFTGLARGTRFAVTPRPTVWTVDE